MFLKNMNSQPIFFTTQALTMKIKSDLSIEYPDFKLHRGECLGIFGANGCGKSTLLKICAGLRFPSTGSVKIDGSLIRRGLLRNAPSRIGFFPQSNPGRSEITFGQLLSICPKSIFSEAEFRETLRIYFPSDEILDRKSSELSFGQCRVCALLLLLSMRPSLLLLDEPFVGLRPDTTDLAINELNSARVESVTLIVDHDLGRLRALSNYIIEFKPGGGSNLLYVS